MAVEVIMPKAGMAMEEGTIIKWFKKEGDPVKEGEALLEIITDKVNMEVEAELSGTLVQVIGQEGDVLPVFEVIAYIAEDGEDLEKFAQEGIEKEKVRATPAARFEAKQRGLDLKKIPGTGPKERIQKADVENYQQKKASPLARRMIEAEGLDISKIEGSGHDGKIMSKDLEAFGQNDLSSSESLKTPGISREFLPEANSFVDYQMTPIQKTIARRMAESYSTSPSFSLNTEVDMKNAKGAILLLKGKVQKKLGVSPTITDLIILAVSKALDEHPQVNASLEGDQIRVYGQKNIALAVGTEKGLLVPVLKNVEGMNLGQISRARKDLVERANAGKLDQGDIEGSTFTISNLGMYGITSFTSIINQPNAAILSVGAVVDRVVAHEGEAVIRPIMNLTLTIDHRIFDGLQGAKFLQSLKENLEQPLNLLV